MARGGKNGREEWAGRTGGKKRTLSLLLVSVGEVLQSRAFAACLRRRGFFVCVTVQRFDHGTATERVIGTALHARARLCASHGPKAPLCCRCAFAADARFCARALMLLLLRHLCIEVVDGHAGHGDGALDRRRAQRGDHQALGDG